MQLPFRKLEQDVARPDGPSDMRVVGRSGPPSRPRAHGLQARSDTRLGLVRGKVERETGFEPATFSLGS